MKKIFSILLAAALLFTMLPTGLLGLAVTESEGGALVSFDTIEEDFDGETVNPIFENAGTVQDGKLYMSVDDNIEFGYLTNFVFEADVIFKGIVGKKEATTASNTLKFSFGAHDVRYFGQMSTFNEGGIEYHRLKWDETPVVGSAVSEETTDNTGKKYIGWVVTEVADVHGDGVLLPVTFASPDGASTKQIQYNTMVMEELIPELWFQTHCTACGSSPVETVIGAGRMINPANADDVVRFRVEVLGNKLKIQAFYNDTMYGIERIIDAKNGGNYAGGIFNVGGILEGAVAILDNVKFANLDTVRANGEIAGAALSTTTLLPGTPDDATGIVYGTEVDVDVFGTELPVLVGGDVTIAADGYDYNKAGVRKNATLMVGDAVIGNYDITYQYDALVNQTIDFSSEILPAGWSHNGTIADGKLTMEGSGTLKFADSVEDFELEYDYTQTLLDPSAESNYLVNTYFWRSGTSQVELSPWMDTRTTSSNGSKWRLMLRNGGTPYTAATVISAKNTSLISGNTYRVKVTGLDGVLSVQITDIAADAVVMDGSVNVPTVDANAAIAGYFTISSMAGVKVEIDNIKLTNLKNVADQTPYNLTLSDDVNIIFNASTTEFSAKGTATADFYGFKESGTINLADVVDEMVYIGNNAVRWGRFELPCTVEPKTVGVNFEGDLPSGWTTTDKFTTENGKYLVTRDNSRALNYALNFNDYIVEYDITPYLVQFITGSVISLELPGPGNVKYEVAVYFDNYNSYSMNTGAYDAATFPEIGDTTSKLGGYTWRMYDRNATRTQTYAGGDIAPVGNSTVTSLSPETNEAFATKNAFEDSVTYRVRVEMIGASIKVKIAVVGDEAIDWESVPYQESLTRNDRIAATGTLTFSANMDDCEALIDNIIITEVFEDATITGYESATQVLKVGSNVSEIDASFKTILSNGLKYNMPAEFIDSISGFDSTKLGYQTVTLNYGEIAIEKQLLVVDYDVFGFENFEGYNTTQTKPSTGSAPVAGATLNWNTNAGTVIDGAMTSTQAYHLVGGHSPKDKGVIAADITFPVSAEYEKATAAKALAKYCSAGCVNFGIGFKTAEPTKAVVFIGIGSNALATTEIPFALGTTYRLEMRIYGNVIQGYIDGRVVLTHVTADATVLTAIARADRWGFDNCEATAIVARYYGGSNASIGEALIDNVILGKDYTTYTVDGSAAEEIASTLPTQAQPGDVVCIQRETSTGRVLMVNDTQILPEITEDGVQYTFEMPAEDVTLELVCLEGYHDFEWVIDRQPTCGVEGKKHQVCLECGEIYNENTEIPATGEHKVLENVYTISNSSSYPFALNNGTYNSTNKSNNSTSTFTITATHNTTLEIEYSTSTESGYDKLTIKQNSTTKVTASGTTSWTKLTLSLTAGDKVYITYSKDYSVANGSDAVYFRLLQGWVSTNEVDPTCTEPVICDVCDTVVKEAGHTFVWVTDTEPTCDAAGIKHEECSVCGVTRNENTEIPATSEHTFAWVTDTEPTCGVAGVKHELCFVCGETRNENTEIPATGTHTYDNDYDADCNICGAEREVENVQTGTTGDCTWTLVGTTLTISGNGAMESHNYYSASPWGNAITSVIIREGVTSIGNYAFYECSGLTSITIPDSVTYIGEYAFGYCSSLTSITIPDSVTSIGEGAFYNTGYYDNSSNWENDVLYIGNHLIKASTSISGSYTIKTGTITIAGSAFRYCSSLTDITIPDSVTSIGSYAFDYCTGLTSITIPDGVTSIGTGAFDSCFYLTDITIPDSVTSIGSQAFACTGLTSITIPDSVTSIGSSAFSYCFNLISITIPDSVTSIGRYAFYCTSLQEAIYTGTQAQWDMVQVADGNTDLTNVLRVIGDECAHNYVWVIDTEPTCGAAGTKHEECSACGATRNENTEIPATGEHTFVWVTDTEPTCGATGVKHEECSACGATHNENTEIPATGEHAFVWVTDTEPTCGVVGAKHELCSVCGEIRNENTEIPATGEHTFAWVTDTEPTCGATGVKHEECSACGVTRNENTEIPATGEHIFDDDWCADTNCDICGALLEDRHIYSWVTRLEPTCGEDGEEHLICAWCGTTFDGRLIPATGNHTYDNDYDADCNICGAEREVEAPVGNNVQILGNSMTCAGQELTYIVSLNGCADASSVGLALSHSDAFELVSVEWLQSGSLKTFDTTALRGALGGLSNANINGNLLKIVLRAKTETQDASFGVQIIVKNGINEFLNETTVKNVAIHSADHTFDHACDTDCNICGFTRVTEHAFAWITDLDPTCVDTGLQHEECSACGEKRNVNTVIPATGVHNYVWITDAEPTCGATGAKHEECVVCGRVRNENTVIPATGLHDFINAMDPDCDTCGTVREIENVSADNLQILGSSMVCVGQNIELIVNVTGCTDSTSVAVVFGHSNCFELVSAEWLQEGTLDTIDANLNMGALGGLSNANINGRLFKIVLKATKEIDEAVLNVQLIAKNGVNTILDATITREIAFGIAGDLNNDGLVSDADAVYLLMHTFFADFYPVAQDCDFNKDGLISDADAVYLLMYTFFPDFYPIA